MRFYDRKLQDYANSDEVSLEECYRVNESSRRLYDLYQAQLKQLLPRLGARNYKLLSSRPHLIFDSNLLGCSLGDKKGVRLNFKRGAAIHLLDFEMNWIYELKYEGINSFSTIFPEEQWFDDRGCGNLLWNEVTSVSSESLSHEFLFTTGLEIKIEFEKMSWNREKVDGYKPMNMLHAAKKR